MIGDVIANGAAWYLVDAAYPARAGINDSSSYGDVLRQRYESGLADLAADIERIIGELAPGELAGATSSGISGEFPRPFFRDRFNV